MAQSEFWDHLWLTVVDKGMLASIILGAGYFINRALEGFKGKLSSEQEATRNANSAVLDLTKTLAKGSNLISWLAWNATQSIIVLGAKEFESYNKNMIDVLSDLVGLQAAVAALDTSSFETLSSFADEIYDRDSKVAEAKLLCYSGNVLSKNAAIEMLKQVYDESIDFDKRLLDAVSGLLAR